MAQRIQVHTSYRPSLPWLDQLDADVLTFEATENDGAELAEIAAAISKDKKICIGVVNHRVLQVESPEQVAALIRKALKHIEPERLIVSSDCGFGRQGMSRAHAFYKMVAIVHGTNIVRRELGLPEATIRAADSRYALI
jgi:5-methyltetrahydropteroyltriglutamate--homocysteine methyltransferase